MNVFSQARTILYKNYLCSFRNKTEILKELAVPLISCLVIWASETQGFLADMLVPIYLPLSITGFSRQFLIDFVNEKTEKYKEYQKIMGLQQSSYILGWFLTIYLKGFVTAAIILIFLFQSSIGAELPVAQTILTTFLYTVAAIHQTFAVSCLFSKPKIAAEVGTLITSLPSLFYFSILFDQQSPQFVYFLICFFPQPAFSFAIMSSATSANNSILTLLLGKKVPTADEANIMLFIDCILYFVLFFYLEQVFPNEYGIKQKPCFCLADLMPKKILEMRCLKRVGSLFKRSRHTLLTGNESSLSMQLEMNERINTVSNPAAIDLGSAIDSSSAIYHEAVINMGDLQMSIDIKNLSKHFAQTKAVDDISMKIYKNQIFCILGHNGAGKTTTISLLTGIFGTTDGIVKVLGFDLKDDLDEIRRHVGICTQKDILYENMSVEEHLQFVSDIKCISKENLKRDLEAVIAKVGLMDERKKLSKHLSGGNKRKLSLGMALMGGSKVIFLDEPTSGMDPVTRRLIWNILSSIKSKERSIILTTHHLDEADILADRIAIMARGKLLTVGSSDFIKKNFGVGYHLVLTPNSPIDGEESKVEEEEKFLAEKQKFEALVSEIIQDAVVITSLKTKNFEFILPFKEQKQFPKLLKALEEKQKTICFNINLEMNTLEDAFINIGLDEHKYFQNKDDASVNLSNPIRLNPPECLSREPTYIFWQQFVASFLRKYYSTVREWQTLICFLLPVLFIISGCAIGHELMSEDKLPEGIKIYFVALFIVQAYSFNSSIYISLPVTERELNLKYALNVMGCRSLPYWLGTFVFDYIAFLISFVLMIIIIYSMGLTFIIHYLDKVGIIMIFFGISMIQFSYMMGFLFNKGNTAFKVFPIVAYFLFYSVPMIIVFSLSGTNWNKPIQIFVYCVSPFYLLNIAMSSLSFNIGFEWILTKDFRIYILFFLIQIVIFTILTSIFEKWKFNLKEGFNWRKLVRCCFRAQTTSNNMFHTVSDADHNVDIKPDDDVIQEEHRLENPLNQDPIKALGIKKTYPNGYVALKGVSFGSNKSEIFGLLGPNGAGKSTSFGICTALIPKSSGAVFLDAKELKTGIMEVFKNTGVCPQFDCLWQHLTPPEHLLLFGRLKGLSGKDLKEATEYYVATMQLEEFKNTKALNLSGGNKRKLCVSNALIGGPSLQFFDEPSTGLDPIAKRYLWNTLTMSLEKRKSSIILTTHSMNEAEMLCQRIGILINGKFVCNGSIERLKEKYGEGYRVLLKTGKILEANDAFLEKFPKAEKLTNTQPNNLLYKIKISDFSFSQLFSFLEDELKESRGLIDDFSVSQSSLEQIFIYFSKFQATNESAPVQTT